MIKMGRNVVDGRGGEPSYDRKSVGLKKMVRNEMKVEMKGDERKAPG